MRERAPAPTPRLLGLLELASRLGEEDIVERRRVEPEVDHREVLAVERPHDLGQRLHAAAQPHRGRSGRRCDRRAEALQHGRDGVAVVTLGGLNLERRPPDLRLQRLGRAAGDDPPVVDDRDPVGEHVRLLEVLRGEEDGHTVLAGQARDLLPQVRAALRVEPRGRLVEEQDARGVHERERQVEPALHPARVATNAAVGRVEQAHPLEQGVATRASLALRDALQRRLQPHVVAPSEQRVERGLLQRRADGPPDGGALAHDVVPGHPSLPRARRQQRREHQHGGRLAGAVGPEEAVDLARLDAQVDAVDRPHAALELADEPFDLDPVLRHRVVSSRDS